MYCQFLHCEDGWKQESIITSDKTAAQQSALIESGEKRAVHEITVLEESNRSALALSQAVQRRLSTAIVT